jgi:hypothetical protein
MADVAARHPPYSNPPYNHPPYGPVYSQGIVK